MPDVAYATASGKFLVTWFQGSPYGIYGRLLNPDASAAGSVQPMLPSNFGSYDANSLAYNDATDTFVTASITPQPNVSLDTIGGAEVSNGGVPSTAMRFVEAAAGTGHRRYPEVAASDNNARFLTIFNKQQSTFWGQLLNTATGGGGGQPPPPPPPPPGHVQTTTAEADFSGDSLPDLLWRRSDGLVAYWRMSGLTATATVFLPGADPSWSIAGTGDLNGDGKPEIIWRHQAGHVFAWFVNGNTLAGGSYLNPSHVDTSWRLAAVADINLDGRADLLWQQTTGALYVWYMNGATMASVAPLSPGNAGGDWQLKGAGDLNGDGRPDLVWQSPSSGAFAAWIMNGAAASKMEWLSPTHVGSDWALRAVVDLTGDGKSDIVWQHSTGVLGAWVMNGPVMSSFQYLSPVSVSPDWTLAGPK